MCLFRNKAARPGTCYCNEGSLRVQMIHFFILSLDCFFTMVLVFVGDFAEAHGTVNSSY